MTLLALASLALGYQFSGAVPVAGDKVRRPARLFVAGHYPDKGVTITRADLAQIVANFSATQNPPVPVKTEHSDTPLDPLGEVSALYLEGEELYGVLTFSPGMDAHIRERGVEHLSIALVRDEQTGYTLKETSLVFTPRVATAGFLSPVAVDAKIAAFAAAGKITPATRRSAARLLSAPQRITFSDGSEVSVAGEFEAFLCALPPVQPRGAAPGLSLFSAPVEGPSAETIAFAKRFGADPENVHARLALSGKEI